MLQVQTCALEATQSQIRIASHAPDRQAKFKCQMLQVPATDIFQFHVFEQMPHSLLRIEFGRAVGQLLHLDGAGRGLRQKCFDRLAAMDVDPVPKDQQAAAQLSPQMLEEPHAVVFGQGVGFNVAEQVSGGGETAHDAQVGVRLINPQLWTDAAGRVSAHRCRQEIKARFINKHGHLPFSQCPFFKRGHRSARQCRTSSSSRWAARRRGTWGVQFKALSKRDTCAL